MRTVQELRTFCATSSALSVVPCSNTQQNSPRTRNSRAFNRYLTPSSQTSEGGISNMPNTERQTIVVKNTHTREHSTQQNACRTSERRASGEWWRRYIRMKGASQTSASSIYECIVHNIDRLWPEQWWQAAAQLAMPFHAVDARICWLVLDGTRNVRRVSPNTNLFKLTFNGGFAVPYTCVKHAGPAYVFVSMCIVAVYVQRQYGPIACVLHCNIRIKQSHCACVRLAYKTHCW